MFPALYALTLLACNAPADATEYGKIYWSDSATDRIARANLDFSGQQTIASGLLNPFNLNVDLTNRKLYWSEQGSSAGIYRAEWNGSGAQFVKATGSIVYGLDIDENAGQIYWSNLWSLNRTSADGLQTAKLRTFSTSQVRDVELDPVHQKLYWSEPEDGRIMRLNLDGTGLETAIVSDWPGAIALDPEGGKIYWEDYSAGTTYIRRADLDGGDREALITIGSPSHITSVDVDPVAGKIYWTDLGGQKIGQADLDGGRLEYIVPSGIEWPSSVAVIPVPEPVTASLIITGAAVMSVRPRRRTAR